MIPDRYSAIFTPIKLGRVTAKNRIEVGPAGCFLTARGGGNSEQYMQYIKPLAAGGAAIVTQGVSSVDELGSSSTGRILNVGSDSFVHDLYEITECIHSMGALASIELVCSCFMRGEPRKTATETSKEDIREIFRLFANGAKRCVRAGFDMIMIHGGHGNVPAMFFSRMYNKRADEYGGSFENRCRFAGDLLDAIRSSVGDDLSIEYRISAEELIEGGSEIPETIDFAKTIEDKIDLIHVSRSLLHVDSILPEMFPPAYYPRAINLDAAERFKKELSIPVSVVGGFDLEHAEAALKSGKVDVVAMVRNMLADPFCVENLRRGQPEKTRPCVRCNSCIDKTHSHFLPVRCAVNAVLGRETQFLARETAARFLKKVVIAGGGPAGLEAARVASGRGHRVVLLEKTAQLGGTLNIACAADFKYDMKKYLDWSIKTVLSDPGIQVKLNTAASKETILAEAPDALIAAVGSKPIIPDMPSDKAGKTVWVGDVELGLVETGDRVVLAGAGFTGLEAALSLARKGKKVTVIDMLPEEKIGADGIHISVVGLRKLLARENVSFICSVRLCDVNSEGAVVSDSDGNRKVIPCDSVVLSLGVRPDTENAEQIAGLAAESYIIGDCSSDGGTLYKAVHSAFNTAMRL
ncbi:MAG: FAD-dependent oxidoreductase [Clostridiales bacterium]|nr:FAD-dependent oxidoreductase [Clostridiales bacterium]